MTAPSQPPSQHPTRRRVLQGIGIGAAGAAATAAGLPQWALSALSSPSPRVTGRTPPGYEAFLWSDPRSWDGGKVPGPGDIAVVKRPVVLDRDVVAVKGLRIHRSGSLVFPPGTSTQLHSVGNAVVDGQLVMRPAGSDVAHVLRFTGADEQKFTGGGMEVLENDVGLWVVGKGVVDAAGSPKRAWTRATGPLAKGATSVTVADASGWQVGDHLAITPTTRPSGDNGNFRQDVDHCLTYDEVRIAAITGTTIKLDRALSHPHPVVELTDWTGAPRRYAAEVLNLTRNVVIEGQPDHKAHVMFLHNGAPQHLSHVEARHLGPRMTFTNDSGKEKTQGFTGRYGIHFHHCSDGSRGSVLEGVVAHDIGSHAFVPHDSHGITMRDCVAHDVRDTAFWYDLPERNEDYKPSTHDNLWERCVASKVWADERSQEGFRMAGFMLTEGEDGSNRCIECVAVGVHSDEVVMNNTVASGFQWPERGRAIWVFHDCLAHNIGGSGSLAWQNDERVHVLERFVAYHNGKAGVDHGAYQNFWHYRDMALFGNRVSGVSIHATTRRTGATPPDAPPLRFDNIVVQGAGITQWGVSSEGHRFPAPDIDPTVVRNVRVSGCKGASYHEPQMNNRSFVHVVDCQFAAPEFKFADDCSAETKVIVDRLNGGPGGFTLRRKDQPGAYVSNWNASRS